jgi:hypothetical protein
MQLEQDVSFYRQVMTPDAAELGLIIAEVLVVPASTPGSYRYRAVFRLAGAGDRNVEGSVVMTVAGQQGDERQVHPMLVVHGFSKAAGFLKGNGGSVDMDGKSAFSYHPEAHPRRKSIFLCAWCRRRCLSGQNRNAEARWAQRASQRMIFHLEKPPTPLIFKTY